jgi:hypothetical protein
MKGHDMGWVVVPLMVIIILLLWSIATKGPPDDPTLWQQPPAPINVTVEVPKDCTSSTRLHQVLCETGN